MASIVATAATGAGFLAKYGPAAMAIGTGLWKAGKWAFGTGKSIVGAVGSKASGAVNWALDHPETATYIAGNLMQGLNGTPDEMNSPGWLRRGWNGVKEWAGYKENPGMPTNPTALKVHKLAATMCGDGNSIDWGKLGYNARQLPWQSIAGYSGAAVQGVAKGIHYGASGLKNIWSGRPWIFSRAVKNKPSKIINANGQGYRKGKGNVLGMNGAF
jgi:hypothetical protein